MQTLIFAADDGSTGSEFYAANGTDITFLGDLNPGNNDAFTILSAFQEVRGGALFAAFDPDIGSELFFTDGTPGGTRLVEDIAPGPTGSAPFQFAGIGDTVIFAAASANGVELYSSDGTEEGTGLLRDIRPGVSSSFPEGFTEFNDGLIFLADDGATGRELWFTDGTEFGTRRLRDINPGGDDAAAFAFEAGLQESVDNVLGDFFFFAADNGTVGLELWRTDGTEDGTFLVSNINPTPGVGSSPAAFSAFNGRMYFQANDGVNGVELWVSDGTNSGTQILQDINPAGDAFPAFPTPLGDQLIFSATDGVNGTELWVTDGTPGGAELLRDINGGGGASAPRDLTVLGDQIVFTAFEPSTGTELYVTDGTVEGTRLLADIAPGGFSSEPINFVVAGDLLYFRAFTSETGRELWVTDGTTEGTQQVADIDPGADEAIPVLLGSFTPNEAPGPVELSAAVVADDAAIGTVVGTVSGSDPNDDPLSFRLTDDAGGLFQLVGDELQVAAPLDADAIDMYMIELEADDGLGGVTTTGFLITETETITDDLITGTSDADMLDNGGPGMDTIDGLGGLDTVTYDVPRAETMETRTGDASASFTTPDGTDTLLSVERVVLEDGVYIYDIDGSVESSAFTYRVYNAAYARIPDEPGFRFWNGQTAETAPNPLDEKGLAQFFLNAPEAIALYGPDQTDEEFITALYNNALLRDPDDEGFDFWLTAFESGRFDRADMLVFFAESPENIEQNADNLDDGIFLLEDFVFA